jgi:hypothetical protein
MFYCVKLTPTCVSDLEVTQEVLPLYVELIIVKYSAEGWIVVNNYNNYGRMTFVTNIVVT